MTDHDVFISYARRASAAESRELHRALGEAGITAFLDTDAVEDGDRFPRRLVDAVMGARVFVMIASRAYFDRWFCLRELELALAPFDETVRRGAGSAQRAGALHGIVVGMAPDAQSADMSLLPPDLLVQAWPPAASADRVVALVEAALVARQPRFGERLANPLAGYLAFDGAVPPPGHPGLTDRRVPASLPTSYDENFVGRATDLWRLHTALRSAGTRRAQRSVVVGGGAGVGKSRLALEYLWRFAGGYPGGCFWVDAGSDDLSLEERLHAILESLQPRTPPLQRLRTQGSDVAALLGERLRTSATDQKVLFVVDNVPEPGRSGEPPSLAKWCPALGAVATLATTRWRGLAASGDLVDLQLEPLTPDAGARLLSRDAPQSSDEEDWRTVSAWVGHLPMVLEVLNAALKSRMVTMDALLDAVEREGPFERVDAYATALRGLVPEGSVRSISQALLISYDKISPAEQLAAQRLAVLSGEPVPMALVEALGVPDRARAGLTLRSMILPAATAAEVDMFGRMHAVMAGFLRAHSGDLAAPHTHAQRAVLQLMTSDACQHHEQWPLMRSLVSHAEHLIEQGGGEAEDRAKLNLQLGVLFWAQGLFRRAEQREEAALGLARSELGEHHPVTLRAMSNLAETWLELARPDDAAQILRVAAARRQAALGVEDENTLISYNNLAHAYLELHDAARAKEILDWVVPARRRLLGADHRRTLTSEMHLGNALRMLGLHDDAIRSLEDVADRFAEVQGPDHLDTLKAMGGLALAHLAAGEGVDARAVLERIVPAAQRVLGEEHPKTIGWIRNLAAVLRELGDDETARQWEQRPAAAEDQRRQPPGA